MLGMPGGRSDTDTDDCGGVTGRLSSSPGHRISSNQVKKSNPFIVCFVTKPASCV